MIPTSTNSGAFQQLLAVSTSLRSQMQSVVLVRSHHKHTHLVGRSFSCLFLSPAFSHCDAQAESWRLCFWIHNLQQALCHSLEILWESIELHSLRHRSMVDLFEFQKSTEFVFPCSNDAGSGVDVCQTSRLFPPLGRKRL